MTAKQWYHTLRVLEHNDINMLPTRLLDHVDILEWPTAGKLTRDPPVVPKATYVIKLWISTEFKISLNMLVSRGSAALPNPRHLWYASTTSLHSFVTPLIGLLMTADRWISYVSPQYPARFRGIRRRMKLLREEFKDGQYDS